MVKAAKLHSPLNNNAKDQALLKRDQWCDLWDAGLVLLSGPNLAPVFRPVLSPHHDLDESAAASAGKRLDLHSVGDVASGGVCGTRENQGTPRRPATETAIT